MIKDFVSHFKERYYDLLNTPAGNNPARPRGDSLLLVFQKLQEMDKPSYRIVETGCMRSDHGHLNFGGDGCATLIFDDFISQMFGDFHSVDINARAVEYARAHTKNATIFCEDSVTAIRRLALTSRGPFDLVYLDSYDIEQANPHPSQLHHLKELCAVIPNLRAGSLVAVDDHDAFFTGGQIGKGNYVKEFMQQIGAKILYEGYQIVFEMP